MLQKTSLGIARNYIVIYLCGLNQNIMINTFQRNHQAGEKSAHGLTTAVVAVVLLVLALLLIYPLYVSSSGSVNTRANMAKGSDRNSKHVQPKAKEQAEEAFEKIKQELEGWKSKPNKTPEDKDYIKKLRKKLEQLRKKKDFSGENHSQKHKGH